MQQNLNYIFVAKNSIKSNREKLFAIASKKISDEDMLKLVDCITTRTNATIINGFIIRKLMKSELAVKLFFHSMYKNNEEKAQLLLPFVKLTPLQKQLVSQIKE